jgi:orotate phosphoribosyltransferase
MMQSWSQQFIEEAIRCEALRFGDFTLKSGRQSPYFFNAGQFSSGRSLRILSHCYRQALQASGISYDMLFGPAYKGIPLAAALACAMHEHDQQDVPYAYDRKEAKQHGEGGMLVGAPINGNVIIIDDVISAGTSARYSAAAITQAGGTTAALLVALDRQERGQTAEVSASAELEHSGIPVIAIATLSDVIAYLDAHQSESKSLNSALHKAVAQYQQSWGAP